MKEIWGALFTVTLLGCGSGSAATPTPDDVTSDASNDDAQGSGATETIGCSGDSMLPVPADPSLRGPWAVGARTITLGGLRTEVWYPARPGSASGKTKLRYDIREHLPASERTKITDEKNPWQDCDCYADLPLDDAHGPYPLVVFVHGTAAFRTQSQTINTHWASRGFVVIAADHPGIQLEDVLSGSGGFGMGADQAGDVKKMLADKTPDFLGSKIDRTRIALSGHSAGGGAIAGLASEMGVQVLIPMAAQGTTAGGALKSTLIMGAQRDGIARYSGQQSGYASSPTKKRLVGIANAGHLAFSDLCALGADRGGIFKIADDAGVNIPMTIKPFLPILANDGCGKDFLSPQEGWTVVDYASTAVLEETLRCDANAADKLSALETKYPSVGEYQEAK
ncbi:MAG: alpha/beta hydrolase family protein [Polyangiales bacterium]